MGDVLSCIIRTYVIVQTVRTLLDSLDINCTLEDFLNAHGSGDIHERLRQLSEIAINLDGLTHVPDFNKCVFICCNTYTNPKLKLGVGPLNDALTVASYMRSIGYTVYYFHNPKSYQFLDWLKYFLAYTRYHLMVYYTGHGTCVDDLNGDESDGKDEAMVFDDNIVIDDVLAQVLINYKTNDYLRVLLLNDCCHSATIWDLDTRGMRPNILQISAARDNQTAKQTRVGNVVQGIFTFYFFKIVSAEPLISPIDLKAKEQPYLNRFNQTFNAITTNYSMLSTPIFPYR